MGQFIKVNGIDVPMERIIAERQNKNNEKDLEIVLLTKKKTKSKKSKK